MHKLLGVLSSCCLGVTQVNGAKYIYVIAFLCKPQVSGVGLRVVSPLRPRLELVPGGKGEGRGEGRFHSSRAALGVLSWKGGCLFGGGELPTFSLDLCMSSLYRFLSTLN